MKQFTFKITLPTLALLLTIANPAMAGKPKKPETNDFLLRTSAASIDSLAARNGLEVLEVVEASADALGRSVFLVRAPLGLEPSDLLETIDELEPDAMGIEEVTLASLPEADTEADLEQSTVAILGWLGDPTEYAFGKSNGDGPGEDRWVWGAYLFQPAASVLRVDEAQDHETGKGVTVAIIDSGVDPDHPLLADRLVPGYDFIRDEAGYASEWSDLDQSTVAILGQSTVAILGGEDAVPLNQSTVAILGADQAQSLDPADLPPAFGHGTMVAGVIHRVAPDASLMPLRAFDGNGNGNLFDILRAIYFAVDNGADVINMSFSLQGFSAELMRAVSYANRHGVTCVASTGNDGEESLVFPAALGNTIGVGSTADDDFLSSFSNFGSDLVTIAAPGENILTTYPGGGWALASGTSFAAPWIAGAAALFEEKNDGASGYYFASSALSFAQQVHGADVSDVGYGRADLKEAMIRLESP